MFDIFSGTNSTVAQKTQQSQSAEPPELRAHRLVNRRNRRSRSRDNPRTYVVVESSMIATPRDLLDTSIAQLQTLTAFLGDHLRESGDPSESNVSPEALACREILISLGALILKVQSTHRLRYPDLRSERF